MLDLHWGLDLSCFKMLYSTLAEPVVHITVSTEIPMLVLVLKGNFSILIKII